MQKAPRSTVVVWWGGTVADVLARRVGGDHAALRPASAEGPLIGNWLFGCDLCQEACPWNDKFGGPASDPRLQPRPELMTPDLSFDEATFDARYADTCFARPGAAGLARNASWIKRNSPQRPTEKD